MPHFLRTLVSGKAPSEPAQFNPEWAPFLDAVPAMLWLADAQGRLLYANEKWREATGLGLDGLPACLAKLVHPDDRIRFDLTGFTPSGGTTSFEFRLRRADGEYRWVSERIHPWRGERGEVRGYLGSAIDVHDQKRHEQRLSIIALRQTSLACFGRFILEHSGGDAVADEALRLFCEHMRFPAALLLRSLEDPEDGAEPGPLSVARARGLSAEAVRLVAGAGPSAVLRYPEDADCFPLDRDWMRAESWNHGVVVPVDLQDPARGCFVGLAHEEPEGAGALHYARDLAAFYAVGEARARTERRLREGGVRALQLQKIESVGLLAGGVAHDFNNLLTAIRCFGEILRDDLRDDTQRSRVDDILHATSRAAHLVRQLLSFSRHEVAQPEPVDLHALVDNLRGFIRSLLSEHVRIDFVLDGESAWCRADPKQIEQVLFNLCLNARDVMSVEGVLTVGVGAGPLSPAGARQVRLSVRDTGPGISPEAQARIFQPFFTTKSRGRGTGLGLAASRAIAREAGGDLTYETMPGRGTVFYLDLPEIASPLEFFAPAPEEEAARPVSRRILLVEDDDLVRAVTVLLAETLGHRVTPFGDSREALAWAEKGGLAELDALMTDIVMPGMSGHDLALRLRAARPELPVLYMSGYVDDEATRAAIGQPGVHFLAKPFSNQELIARLEAVFAHLPAAAAAAAAC
jgi:PAS domain S-box-containing protein